VPGRKAAKDSRRGQILRAGYRVATAVGLDRLTVRLVAAKARLSSGLVLFYFKTKERLVSALLGDVLKAGAAPAAAKGVAGRKSPVTRLFSLVRAELKRMLSEPRRVRLFFEYAVRGFRDPLIRARMRAELRRYREAFRPAAKAVVASEPQRFAHVSAAGLAAVAVGVVEGGAMQSVTDPVNFDVDEYLTAAKGLLERPGTTPPSAS
jgi:TetR/AcrR family transcriptional repressor of bet genes